MVSSIVWMYATSRLDILPATDLPGTATAPLTPRRYLSLVGQRPVDADRFAELALRGVARNRAIVVEPIGTRMLWRLHRRSPALVGRITTLLARRVDREQRRTGR